LTMKEKSKTMNKGNMPLCCPVTSRNEHARVYSGTDCAGNLRLFIRTDTPERLEKVLRGIHSKGKKGIKFGNLVSLVNARQPEHKYSVADIHHSVERLVKNGNVTRDSETGILTVTAAQWNRVK